MTDSFCPSCGIKTEGNTTRESTGQYLLSCWCGFTMRFYIQSVQTKTEEEVEAAFQQTELTDFQRTGRANKGKWARKEKKTISSQVEKS